jgi:hypothetical protein
MSTLALEQFLAMIYVDAEVRKRFSSRALPDRKESGLDRGAMPCPGSDRPDGPGDGRPQLLTQARRESREETRLDGDALPLAFLIYGVAVPYLIAPGSYQLTAYSTDRVTFSEKKTGPGNKGSDKDETDENEHVSGAL